MKRFIDFLAAFFGITLISPILFISIFFIWINDFKNPFYIAKRVGKDFKEFKMVKLRTMTIDADKTGVDSTSANDKRITKIGKYIRKYKIDELSQLYNVLIGDMSLVGPRPNVIREVNLYTEEEKFLLSVKPGITDIASIVFSDEGEILRNEIDPDLAYHQLIRPGKNKLGLFYINKNSIFLDLCLIFLTIIAIFNKRKSLYFLAKLLKFTNANEELIRIASRREKLVPSSPPGASGIVTSR